MQDLYYPSADGKTTVHAVVWRPQGEPCGVVQIIHGMCEYAQRYWPFAEFLTQKGFLVCAEDHLGHGQSLLDGDKKNLGYFNEGHNYNIVLDDIRALHKKMRAEVPGVPYFIMGHSMGSFFCRNYIARYGGELSGAIIMGTGFKGGALMNFALFSTRCNALFCGWGNRSKFIKKLAFGAYNKRFKGDNSQNAWLSADKTNVETYDGDPLCGFPFTNNGYYVLFSVIKAACSGKVIKSVPQNLPVYFVSGADDPVGDYGKGVVKAYGKFKKAGVHRVDISLYENARHEILNDFCSGRVKDDILAFLTENSNRS